MFSFVSLNASSHLCFNFFCFCLKLCDSGSETGKFDIKTGSLMLVEDLRILTSLSVCLSISLLLSLTLQLFSISPPPLPSPSLFPGKSSPNCPVHCIRPKTLSNPIIITEGKRKRMNENPPLLLVRFSYKVADHESVVTGKVVLQTKDREQL